MMKGFPANELFFPPFTPNSFRFVKEGRKEGTGAAAEERKKEGWMDLDDDPTIMMQ